MSRTRRSSRPIGIAALAVAALVVGWAASQTRVGREATAPVPVGAFDEVFVAMRTGSTDKCLVSDRAGVTLRRSEPEAEASRWRCLWPRGRDGALAALDGKRRNWLFVPFDEVREPLAPRLWEWASGVDTGGASGTDGAGLRGGGDRLPSLDWVRLYVDRRYRGLFLRVRLPGKRFATARELGRVEMLSLDPPSGDEPARLRCFTRKLDGDCTLWSGSFVAESLLPQPAWTPTTRWLADRLVGESAALAFTLAETPGAVDSLGDSLGDSMDASSDEATSSNRAGALAPWPLPFDLGAMLGGSPDPTSGREAVWRDARYASWRPQSLDSSPPAPPESPAPSVLWDVPDEAEPHASAVTVDEWLERLDTELEAHCAVRACDEAAERRRLRAPRAALDDLRSGSAS